MKRFCLVLLVLLAPSIVWAQGVMTVTGVYGPVEVQSASSRTFVPLSAPMRQVRIGDQIRTGDGGTATLVLPDGTYMVVTPNSTIMLQDYWSSGFRSIANVLLGKVRFYIQTFGGKPNPYRVGTPTALIAVRGTTFEVTVDDAQWTEVWCLEGRVGVESVGLSDREVLLDPGWKTQVRPGQYPERPRANTAAFDNRSFQVIKKEPADVKDARGILLPNGFPRDNDRGNRIPGLGSSPSSTVEPAVSRGKPGVLNYPE